MTQGAAVEAHRLSLRLWCFARTGVVSKLTAVVAEDMDGGRTLLVERTFLALLVGRSSTGEAHELGFGCGALFSTVAREIAFVAIAESCFHISGNFNGAVLSNVTEVSALEAEKSLFVDDKRGFSCRSLCLCLL